MSSSQLKNAGNQAAGNHPRAGRGRTGAETGGGVTPAPQQTAGHRPSGTCGTTREPRAPVAPSRRRGRHMPAAPAAPPHQPASAQSGGRLIDGLSPLWVFLVAALAIVGAVTVTDAVNSWWILVPVMAVFFVSTFAVLRTIMWLLGDDAGAP